MLKSVKDACQPHKMAFDYAMANQIEDLGQLIDTEADGKAFFEKTYITSGMNRLFEAGIERLAGKSEQALFELTQAMGGGKTHTMVALGLIVQNEPLRKSLLPSLSAKCKFEKAKVVALSGRNQPEHFLWGEIARQLGKPGDFKRYWQDGPKAPDENAWLKLLGETPTLILLDELPPFFDYAVTQPVGSGTLAQVATAAFSNLFSAALKLPRVCIVLSNLSGAYEGASKDLRKAVKNLEQEAHRQAKPITPVELASDEVYEILKKRLFAKLPTESVIAEVAQEYAKAIREAEKSKTISKSQEQIADEIRRSYPFHPVIKDLIALFRNNETYRQTRGLMQFVSKLIRSVWNRKTNDVYLIGLQHLDLHDEEVRDEVTRINDLRGAIATDICSQGSAHAEVIDAQAEGEGDAAVQVATLLLAASLSTAVDAVKGLTEQRLLESLIAPQRSVHEFKEAFAALRSEAWYLHHDAANAWYFSNVENLQKRLVSEAERAPQNKIDADIRRRLEEIFSPKTKQAFGVVYALPAIDQVKLNGPRVLLILGPETKNPPEQAKRYYDSVVEKNNFCVLSGDGSDMADLEARTRALWAITKLQDELGDGSPHHRELEEKFGTANLELFATVTSTFNRLYYPTKTGLAAARLTMQYTANDFDGEDQIVKALSQTSVSKLVSDLDKEAQVQLGKAEELLWPENQKKVPWNDVKKRALQNPRWTWLPHNGLEELKKLAESRGLWRYTGDGYIERGPFAKARTSVSFQVLSETPETGAATLQLMPIGAGKSAQIYWDISPKVTVKSKRLTDPKLDTTATRLYFIAVDPNGEHETGEPVPWENTLTITHQPKDAGGKRKVELKVVPRGTIRYSLISAGLAPEADIYKGPFEIGAGEVTVYCHAEDDGVVAKRNFVIPKRGDDVIVIDNVKPARLLERVDTADTAESFKLLSDLTDCKARVSTVKLDVGQGTTNVSVRFGTGCRLNSSQLEAVIRAARGALGDDTAEVHMAVTAVEFEHGADLKDFVSRHGIQLSSGNWEQS